MLALSFNQCNGVVLSGVDRLLRNWDRSDGHCTLAFYAVEDVRRALATSSAVSMPDLFCELRFMAHFISIERCLLELRYEVT
jgi:hypothetical protein